MIGLRAGRVSRAGLTILELIVVVGVVGMLVLLALPNMRMSRGPARRTQCINNMRSLSFAMLDYESANSCLPMAVGDYDDEMLVTDKGFRRLSGMISMLPFMEERALFESISKPLELNGETYPAMGPVPWNSEFPPWATQLYQLECPATPKVSRKFGITNYAFCIGDTVKNIHTPNPTRGAFGCQQQISLKDVDDGTSKTMAFGEIGGNSGSSRVSQFLINQSQSILREPSLCNTDLQKAGKVSRDGRGGRWADGSAGYSLFNSVLPPNSASCAISGEDMADGIYSVGSQHANGVAMVAMLDGSVRNIPQDIDVGDSANNGVDWEMQQSPFGVWGAMGTIAGGEANSD